MKKLLISLLLFIAGDSYNQTNPITLTIDSPTNGSVVSNTITLSAAASSTAGPITKVEWYRDGVLIGVSYNTPVPPKNVQIVSKQ